MSQPRLTHDEEAALQQACTAAKTFSYSPYSHFRVGAALLYASGETVAGANVENASFPAGICAERAALATAVNRGLAREPLRAIAVTSDSPQLVSPCGVCRQSLREFAGLQTPVYMWTSEGALTVRTLDELLPLSFGPDNLK